jgi:dTDP-4-amino-4,6-dideoxygalactose transaminase
MNQELAGRGHAALTARAAPDFPPSPIPRSPVLSAAAFRHDAHPPVPSILDAGAVRHVTSGRVAIALALRAMGVGPGDQVLVPSYHCASMVEPVAWSGATPVFYRIGADTAVDLADIAAKRSTATRVLMVTNYFGFPQALPQLRAFCDHHGLLLLEDCAHSFLGACAGRPLGSFGDYAVASSMKFYPVYEGGCLISARHALSAIALRSAGAGFEAKVAINTLEDGCAHGRLGLLRWLIRLPMALKTSLWTQIKAANPARAQQFTPGSSDGGFDFDPAWLDKRSSLFSRLMLRLVSRRRMGALRRRNYLMLRDAVAGLPGCRPLRTDLPDQVYPWVLPLWVNRPEPVFQALKQAGVPVLRFGEFLSAEVDVTVCPHSVALSRHVLQFPCHQELRDDELAWLAAQLRAALAP